MSIEYKNIELLKDKNDVLEIKLESLGTSGFQWQSEFDSKYFDLYENKYIPSSNNFGAAGFQIFDFKVKKRGKSKIIFFYKRAWEKSHIKKIAYNILIK